MKLVEMEKNNWVFEEDPAMTLELQERFYQAVEVWADGRSDVAQRMLCAVVTECPNHIDAIHHLSLLYSEQERELEAYIYCQAAVGIGLHALPQKFSWRTARLEWPWLENRPFLRAYHSLGMWHLHNDRHDAAIEIFRRLLSVNPNDNQGVRYLLPHCWFEKKRTLENSDALSQVPGRQRPRNPLLGGLGAGAPRPQRGGANGAGALCR